MNPAKEEHDDHLELTAVERTFAEALGKVLATAWKVETGRHTPSEKETLESPSAYQRHG